MAILKYEKDIVDNKKYLITDGMFLSELDKDLFAIIKIEHPKISRRDFISYKHLTNYRLKKLNKLLKNNVYDNNKFHDRFDKMSKNKDYKEIDVRKYIDDKLTFGQKIADLIAKFGGSWLFIILFVSLMVIWIFVNVTHIFGIKFDPYPFILLNLTLSMLAALQAPLIMMSQNRSSEYDRLESTNGYKINKKSEAEIRLLHSKLDHLMEHDQKDSLEIQKLQVEILVSITRQLADLQKK